jgi:histidyl-tRNA synthetase
MNKKPRKRVLVPSLRGMHDILPEDQVYYQKFLKIAEKLASLYNFKRIDTPILERAELFIKGTGAITDIVQKEMYTFRSKGGEWLALRPEGTPPVVRAYLEHGMISWPQPVKLYYYGPFFRHESPQAGRYREFRQFGLEAIGEKDASIDSEIILLTYHIIQKFGLKKNIVEINSIGCPRCRAKYKKLLIRHLTRHQMALCQNCRRRIKANPLRVLDCKEVRCRPVIEAAPQIIDYLCQECHNHFKEVLEYLEEVKIPYTLNPYLVRGLDYYTRTVFEILREGDNQKLSLAGGGRYDGLIKVYSRRDIPACGSAIGVERVIDKVKEELEKKSGKPFLKEEKVQVFLAHVGEAAAKKCFKILEDLRSANISTEAHLGKDSLKNQLAVADKLEASIVLILGQKEMLEGRILIRDMKTGHQDLIKIDKLIPKVKTLIKKKKK